MCQQTYLRAVLRKKGGGEVALGNPVGKPDSFTDRLREGSGNGNRCSQSEQYGQGDNKKNGIPEIVTEENPSNSFILAIRTAWISGSGRKEPMTEI